MEEIVFFKNSQGEKLCGLLAVPERSGEFPVVVACHGFRTGKDGKKLSTLSKRLPRAGIALLRFDFSGLGGSEGKFEDTTIGKNVDDLHSAIEFIKDVDSIDKERIGVFGSSMGGMVSIIEASINKAVKALVLAAPVTEFDWAERTFTKLELDEYKKRGYAYTTSDTTGKRHKLKYEFVAEGRKYDLLRLAKSISCPVLIVHGNKDAAVRYEYSERFFKILKCDKSFETIVGCDHHFSSSRHFNQLIESSVDFFRKYLR